jgi:hypothetical protein
MHNALAPSKTGMISPPGPQNAPEGERAHLRRADLPGGQPREAALEDRQAAERPAVPRQTTGSRRHPMQRACYGGGRVRCAIQLPANRGFAPVPPPWPDSDNVDLGRCQFQRQRYPRHQAADRRHMGHIGFPQRKIRLQAPCPLQEELDGGILLGHQLLRKRQTGDRNDLLFVQVQRFTGGHDYLDARGRL